MGNPRKPGPMCQATEPLDIDDGTSCRAPSPVPGASGWQAATLDPPRLVHSDDARAAVNAVTANAGQLTYDAFVREYVYKPAAEALSRQAQQFVARGVMTRAQAAEWVAAQRNALVINVRDSKNSPLGRALAEHLKPRSNLPKVEDLATKISKELPKATKEEVFQAIIESAGRTRASVNRLAVVLRWGGPVLIAVDIGLTGYLIAAAPPKERGRVAAREIGGLGGGLASGWAGAELGCETGVALGVWFEGVGAIPFCAIGAILGGLGLGFVGSKGGANLGAAAYESYQSAVHWLDVKK